MPDSVLDFQKAFLDPEKGNLKRVDVGNLFQKKQEIQNL